MIKSPCLDCPKKDQIKDINRLALNSHIVPCLRTCEKIAAFQNFLVKQAATEGYQTSKGFTEITPSAVNLPRF